MPTNLFIDPLNTSLAFLPVQFSRNKIEQVMDPANTSLPSRDGLRYFLELLIPNFAGSTTFERLVKMPGSEKPPTNQAGMVVYEGAFFQLDELLDGFLSFTKPAFGAKDMAIISTLTMPYIVKESVENNGVLLAESVKQNASQWLLKAGLNERDFLAWGSSFFTSYMSENRPFLTWQPDGKTIGENQQEYVYFLLNFSPAPASIIRRYRVHYTNGTYETLEYGALSGGQPFQVVSVPVHPAALNLNPAMVDYYEVWLADQDRNRLSQVRTYRVDHSYRSQERWLLFANSLGGWDTMRLLGEGAETLTTERTTAELERPAGAPADYSELRVIHLVGSREITVSTGYFEQAAHHQLKYLDELMLSKEIYLVDSRGHQALEMVTNSLVDKEDNTDLLARNFTFRFSTPQMNHSTMPAAPATPARPMKWQGAGVVQILDSYGKRTGKGRSLKLQRYYADTNTLFKPITEKPNQPGDPDYIESLPLPGVVAGSTPYPSQALTRVTTYKRTTCTGGDIGDVATITIPAGKYGSEISQADADSKAEAEYSLLNTQVYADTYGSCTAAPELYVVAVPAGEWRYRANNGNKFAFEWYQPGDPGTIKIGNTWDLQGQSRAYVYAQYSTDLNFPVRPSDWRFSVYGTPVSSVNLMIYQNGVLRYNQNITMNSDGYQYMGLNDKVTLASMDRLYFKATQL
ncbi:hypothetical protein GO755_39380 [Spirosoma sp. HMF4905]|uniref:DUF5977 domain-containing protein n=1 Tax=Spirosoma arboris TaxID=2682092 RepID=A0A7K1SQR9_9BACT|nr:DUF5977 domain-containing protein [Spirosoma arboris]MVM36141.1 hypothetical protein [Spirosoma arboris]